MSVSSGNLGVFDQVLPTSQQTCFVAFVRRGHGTRIVSQVTRSVREDSFPALRLNSKASSRSHSHPKLLLSHDYFSPHWWRPSQCSPSPSTNVQTRQPLTATRTGHLAELHQPSRHQPQLHPPTPPRFVPPPTPLMDQTRTISDHSSNVNN